MSGELPSWSVRPREIANLLNPAFTALVIARSVAGSEAAGSTGLALPLSFLVLPAVLHPGTRDALPRAATTTMYGWLGEHPHLKALFPARAGAFVPFTQEAIRFGLAHGKMSMAGPSLRSGPNHYAQTAAPKEQTDEVSKILQKAAMIGRWLTLAGAPSTILAAWGVAP